MSNQLFCTLCKVVPDDSQVLEDYREGSIIHTTCGLVLSNHLIDESQEWRNYKDDILDNSRVGESSCELYNNILWGTKISQDADIILQKINHVNQKDENFNKLTTAYKSFDDNTSALNLVSSVSFTGKTFVKIFLNKGYNLKDIGIYGAAAFLACKKHHCSRTLKEIAQSTNIDVKSISKFVQDFNKSSADSELKTEDVKGGVISRACQTLDLSYKYEKSAIRLFDKVGDVLSGRRPQTIAATCLFLILKRNKRSDIDFSTLAKTFDIALSTLKTSCKLCKNIF